MLPNEFRTGVIKPVECFKEGWEIIKSDYWMLFVITLVGAMIAGVSFYVLLGAMSCGIYYCYIRKIDGSPAVSFDDLFKGFKYFMPSLLATILIVVPIFLVIGIVYVPFIMAAVMGARLSQGEMMSLMGGALIVEIFVAFFMVCLHTLLIFTFPLIIDRNLSAIEAVKTSARAVLKNMGGVVGLIGVSFVLSIVGYLALCIGLYFVIPIIVAGFAVAYRKVFPNLDLPNGNNPPPPNAFRGAGNYN
jgi:uncharacterized membrane protein